MNILTILGMVVATSAVTLLCMRFGIAMTKTPIHENTVNYATDDKSTIHNRSKLLVVTISPDTTIELNATEHSISLNQKGMWISLPGSASSTVPEKKAPKNNSTFKHLEQKNSKFQSDIGLVQADSFLARTSTSRNVIQPIDLRDTSINTNPHNRNDNIMTTGDNNENNDGVASNTNMYQLNGRQINQRKMNHNHQLNTNTAKYTTMAEEENPNGYQNSYDLTYNVDDYGYKEYDNPNYETGWTGAGRPQQTHQGSLWSGSSGSWEPPPYGIGEGYIAEQIPSRKPSDRPSSSLTNHDQNVLQPKLNNFNWKVISMLVLFKLGLAKLQAIGFLKTLFLLGFSFKMYMIAVIFKFMLIMKLMKFLKILLLPLFLIRLIPSLIQLLLMPGRILDFLRRTNSTDNNNIMPANQPAGLLPSNQPGGLLPSQPGGLLPSRPAGILPNRPAAATPGNTQRGGMSKDIPISEFISANHLVVGKTNDPLFKLEDTHLTDVQNKESIPLTDSALENFQKLLESEKCVERIACRISVAEKIGNAPFWINWALNRVHKLIPNDKLESYLKAYKDTNDKLRSKSSVPDNWATWCLERYECNSNDNRTNESNTKQ